MTDIAALKTIIESAFENRANITPEVADDAVKTAVQTAIALLNSGEARVAEKTIRREFVHITKE